MIILRQSLFTSAASFKPKFRARFRNGDFTYAQAKDPANETLNHQAYVEVAAEPEFKNNPETYKIRQGMFSEEERRFSILQKINDSSIRSRYNIEDCNERGEAIKTILKNESAFSREFRKEIFQKDLDWLEKESRKSVDCTNQYWKGVGHKIDIERLKKKISEL